MAILPCFFLHSLLTTVLLARLPLLPPIFTAHIFAFTIFAYSPCMKSDFEVTALGGETHRRGRSALLFVAGAETNSRAASRGAYITGLVAALSGTNKELCAGVFR